MILFKYLCLKINSLLYCFSLQTILSEEVISLKFLDIITILLKYCGPKSNEKGETQAVIVDLLSTLGYFCVNNSRNQVSLTTFFFLLMEVFKIILFGTGIESDFHGTTVGGEKYC